MTLPFTTDEFLSVFDQYNRAMEPAPIVAYGFGVAALVLALRGGRGAGRAVLGILAAFWAICGAGYHIGFFSRITTVAIAFGILFLAQAALFAGAALRLEPPAFGFRLTGRHVAGLALAIYAILVYPRLAAAAGHGLPRAPALGVAPCPTAIFTFAVLLLGETAPTLGLLAIPLAWSLVGLCGATHFGMTEDYALPVAAVVALAFSVAERRRPLIPHPSAPPV